MIRLRCFKPIHEVCNSLNAGFSSIMFVNKFCQNLERNRQSLFFNDEVQTLLKGLTKVDYDKVFRPRKLGKRLSTPELKFMTNAELDKARAKVEEDSRRKLQMPPVMSPRTEIDHVLVKDPKLCRYALANYIFTDISFGKDDRTRYIVVRDTDGTLRKASWQERERCNEIYFPREGRKLRTPRMFKPGYFEDVLNKGWFEFILERACIQFEPDDPLYISVTQRTYDKIAETNKFQEFESTRFFGPMIFYFTETESLAPLIAYYLNYDRLQDILDVIKLHNILYPDKKCSAPISPGQEVNVVKAFISERYPGNAELELALKTYEDYMSKPKSQAAV